MRALQIHGAGDLRLVDLASPSLSDGEVRIAIKAGGICGSDLSYYFKGRVGDFALQEPMILGHEVAGEVGDAVRDLDFRYRDQAAGRRRKHRHRQNLAPWR